MFPCGFVELKLLIDIGNSRLKWATATDAIGPIEALAHDGAPWTAIANIECDQPEAIHVSSVVGRQDEGRLEASCLDKWQTRPCFARSTSQHRGLKNRYTDPTRLGVDRWLAMLGAWQACKNSCLVVDAGTALTVDAIDSKGQHLGGIIAAGIDTSRDAVLGQTRFPVGEQDSLHSIALGTDTETCVAQGALMSCLGAIDQASRLAGDARKFICGGDAERLLPLLGEAWEHHPHLVMQGLLCSASSD